MPSDPKVSIVIPVYNGSNYLREAIDSALAQTYKNIEVIVVNDGSRDDGKTEEISGSYGNRIRYLYKDNGGVATALNLGIREMTGEYFSWLSHDDVFSQQRIEEDINLFKANPDARISFCKLAFINGQGQILRKNSVPVKKITNPREALMLGGVNFCSMTIHASCFRKVGLFNEKNKTMQDTEMSLRLANYFPYYHNEKAYVYIREHDQKGTITLKAINEMDRLAFAEYIHDNFSLNDFFPDIKNKKLLSEAWEWLGNVFFYFGANKYAVECYDKSFTMRKRYFCKTRLKYIVGHSKPTYSLYKHCTKMFAELKHKNLFKWTG